jgi:hypothetical protein
MWLTKRSTLSSRQVAYFFTGWDGAVVSTEASRKRVSRAGIGSRAGGQTRVEVERLCQHLGLPFDDASVLTIERHIDAGRAEVERRSAEREVAALHRSMRSEASRIRA